MSGAIPVGDMRLVDNVVPPLPAADYALSVQQAVTLDPKFASPDPYEHVQRIRVTGPHFTLGANDVVAAYPPAGSTNDYSLTLPHVVLARRTLPWEIAVGGASSGPRVAPWLAVLLLTADEIVAPPKGVAASPTLTQAVPLHQYLTPPTGTLGPQLDPDTQDEWQSENPELTCTVVDVRARAFTTNAPGLAELPYLAHVRRVDTADQEILGIDEDGDFAVVVGNRLPDPDKKVIYAAHLVSLEGFGPYLPDQSGIPPDTDAVRVLSLASWTFNSLPSPGDFAALMENLTVDLLQLPQDLAPAQSAAAKAIAAGAVPVAYDTRLGDTTTAWYRGPCSPVQVERNVQPVYGSAEAALTYDRTTGMFDVSFAVAWQVGRLLALANRSFVAAMLTWLRAGGTLAQLLAERLDYFGADPAAADVAATADAPRRAVPRRVADALGRARPFGPACDPSGLAGPRNRAPGLLDRDAALETIASGTHPDDLLNDREEPA